MADRYDILFDPVPIGPKVAPNRFWQTPHATGYGNEFPGMHASYRGMKAEGGWGVVFTEATSVAPETDKVPYVLGRMWDEGDIRNSRHIVDQIHQHGSLAGIELEYHSSGSIASEGRLVNHSVVPVSSESVLPVGYAATGVEIHVDDIPRLQDLHVDAAVRAVEAGFDLITLHCGHAASLLAHFLIPYYNTRTDAYGGPFENRARFARETLIKVRAAVGGAAAVGLRFGVDTLDQPLGLGERGIRADREAPRFIQHMDDLVDYWDLVIGGVDWGQDAQSSRTAEPNHEAKYTRGLKQYTDKPVVNVGRLNSPDLMVDVVRSGQADFVGAARASISDPFLPAKIRERRFEDIRECIGCNVCVSRGNMGNGRIICTQNATIGEEFRRGWHPERYSQVDDAEPAILVVGAGPAGMECAMVLGKRGLENVHLVEAGPHYGGSLNWVTKLPGRHEWRHLIEYRELQLGKLRNVLTVFNKPLSTHDVLDYGAEIVIVATGSRYTASPTSVDPYTRAPRPWHDAWHGRLLAPEDVMDGSQAVGERVLIVDTDGYFVGPGLAEHLADAGHDVTVATPAATFGHYLTYTMELPRMTADLRDKGVRVFTGATIAETSESAVMLSTPHGTRWEDFDSVVVVGQRVARSRLYDELRVQRAAWQDNGIRAVHRVGDCVRPGFIADAIFSGHRLAREIDQPDPDQPLPILRERRLVGSSDSDFVLRGGQD